MELDREDIHMLFELYYMVSTDKLLEERLKANGAWVWFNNFFDRVEIEALKD